MADGYLQVATTTATREAGLRLARGVVDARLAACVQVLGPLTSTYWWNGAVEAADEWLCLMKTTTARFDALAAHITAHHDYETPEITATPITAGGAAYLRWVTAETGA